MPQHFRWWNENCPDKPWLNAVSGFVIGAKIFCQKFKKETWLVLKLGDQATVDSYFNESVSDWTGRAFCFRWC